MSNQKFLETDEMLLDCIKANIEMAEQRLTLNNLPKIVAFSSGEINAYEKVITLIEARMRLKNEQN
jgi:hypothetical protein